MSSICRRARSHTLDWLNSELQAAFESHGKVPQGRLRRLDWPDPSIMTYGESEGST